MRACLQMRISSVSRRGANCKHKKCRQYCVRACSVIVFSMMKYVKIVVLTGAISVELGIPPGSKGCLVLGACCAVTVYLDTGAGSDDAVDVAGTPEGPCICRHGLILAYEHQYSTRAHIFKPFIE